MNPKIEKDFDSCQKVLILILLKLDFDKGQEKGE